MIEIVANYTRSGVPLTGVYTIFGASPYAMFTGYEASAATFARDEPLMRSIAASDTPQPSTRTGVATTTAARSNLVPLQELDLGGGVTMKIPRGWTPQVFPFCAGLIAADSQEHARRRVPERASQGPGGDASAGSDTRELPDNLPPAGLRDSLERPDPLLRGDGPLRTEHGVHHRQGDADRVHEQRHADNGVVHGRHLDGRRLFHADRVPLGDLCPDGVVGGGRPGSPGVFLLDRLQ